MRWHTPSHCKFAGQSDPAGSPSTGSAGTKMAAPTACAALGERGEATHLGGGGGEAIPAGASPPRGCGRPLRCTRWLSNASAHGVASGIAGTRTCNAAAPDRKRGGGTSSPTSTACGSTGPTSRSSASARRGTHQPQGGASWLWQRRLRDSWSSRSSWGGASFVCMEVQRAASFLRPPQATTLHTHHNTVQQKVKSVQSVQTNRNDAKFA